MAKNEKRPKDINQLAKLIVDTATTAKDKKAVDLKTIDYKGNKGK